MYLNKMAQRSQKGGIYVKEKWLGQSCKQITKDSGYSHV